MLIRHTEKVYYNNYNNNKIDNTDKVDDINEHDDTYK